MDEKLKFNNHIEHIITKAKSRLVWVKRFSREFDDPWAINRLYYTFVLPIIEYASPIWSPNGITLTKNIESIQKQFLIFAIRKFKWPKRFDYPSYKHRLLFFHMNTLEDRRSISQILFILSVINANISSPKLLSLLNFGIPTYFMVARHSLEIGKLWINIYYIQMTLKTRLI